MPATSRQQPQQHPLSLPPSLSPDSLDALTELAAIVSLLRLPQSSSQPGPPARGGTPAPTTGGGPGATGTTPLPTASTPMGPPPPAAGGGGGATAAGGGGGAGASFSSAGGGSGGDQKSPTLSIKELPHATDALKHKLQRARQQIKTLPDMHRSVAEQEATIAELERTVRLQREVLGRLRGLGVRFGAEEEAGGGVGGGDRMDVRMAD